MIWSALALAAEPEADGSFTAGVGIGIGSDVPDRTGAFGLFSRCGSVADKRPFCPPTLHLMIPARLRLSENAFVRLSLAPVFGVGEDEWSWQLSSNSTPESLRVRAFFASLPITVGPEIVLPVEGALRPSFGGGVGLAYAATLHSRPRLVDLHDPTFYTDEALANSWTLEPFVLQPTFAGNLFFSLQTKRLWFEFDYAMQYLQSRSLRWTREELFVKRAPLQWNTLSLAVGIPL